METLRGIANQELALGLPRANQLHKSDSFNYTPRWNESRPRSGLIPPDCAQRKTGGHSGPVVPATA